MEMLSSVMVGFAFGFGVGALFVWWMMRRQVRDLEAGWRAERAQYGVWGAPKARPWPRPKPPLPDVDVAEPWQKADRAKPPPGLGSSL